MTSEEFMKSVSARLDSVVFTLTGKADEYARGDRLSNFFQIAQLTRVTPERALTQLVAKHIVALYDFIGDLDEGKMQSAERWNEKIGDIIAYMVLLDAMLTEKRTQTGQGLKETSPTISSVG